MENINFFMDFSNPIFKLLIALFLGAFVGMRREVELQRKGISGIRGLRTSAFITTLAAISTFFPKFPYLPVILLIFLSIGVVISYIGGMKKGLVGWTSEISLLLLFFAGLFIGYEKFILGIILAFTVAISDAYKEVIHNFAENIKLKEWSGTLQMILISLVVLPFLPKKAIDPWGVVVPYNIWVLVILVSGIGFLGYFLNKSFSKSKIKGVYLTSFIGSILSSTAVTVELSQRIGKENKKTPAYFVPAILLAIFVMEVRDMLIILLATKSFDWNLVATPIIMAISSLILFGYYFWKDKKEPQVKMKLKEKSPFELLPALKFAAIFVIILFLVYFVKRFVGENGVYLTTVIVSLVDTETIILPGIESYKNGVFDERLLTHIITIAIVMNTLIKLFYIRFFANNDIFKKGFWPILFISILGLLPLLF